METYKKYLSEKMSMTAFIKKNKKELISAIKSACPNCKRFDNEEIENWIMNDEGLYNWAKSEGVDIDG